MEKSLKQREQLEGYLRDKDSKDKKKVVKDFQKIFDKEEKIIILSFLELPVRKTLASNIMEKKINDE